MGSKTLVALAAVLSIAAVTPAECDVVTQWNEAALGAIREHGTPPPAAARNLAILHASMHDAVVGIRRSHEPYLVDRRAPAGASVEAAASAAARTVLSALYPADEPVFAALHRRLAGGVATPPRQRGSEWGAHVARQILAERADDGSTAVAEWSGAEAPGQWRPTVSFGGVVRPALAPLWGRVEPFALESGSQFRPPPPPALGSRAYADDLNEVREMGRLDSTSRSVDQTEIALFWGYGPGSATPPGHWNQIAQAAALDRGNSLAENARLFALLNLALADAAIASWDCKYEFNYWRPVTAIQLAADDGNPWTSPDAGWMPLLPTPPFPEYTSGHSTFSGAAAVVLAMFFGRDDVAFSVGSDDLPGVVRSYGGFWQAAVESGVSRIYGGIHFGSANVQGLLTGARTGMYVFENRLRPWREGRHRKSNDQ